MAIVANEKWNLKAYDVRSAFLLSENLQRDIDVKPPPERKQKGMVWKLIKPVYGLVDASKLWYNTIKLRFLCFYIKYNSKLEGLRYLMFMIF